MPIALCWWIRPSAPGDGGGDFFAFELTSNLFALVPVIAGGFAVIWMLSVVALLRKATGCGCRGLLAAALLLPAIWAACLIGIPIVAMLTAALVVLIKLSFP